MKVVVVTGVSGAGKSTALRALEDLGFYCADNLPMPLLPKFIELLAAREEVARAALVVDARSGDFLDDAAPMLAGGARGAGTPSRCCSWTRPTTMLIRRFSETRRRHPLSGSNVREGLAAERTLAGAPAPGGHHGRRHRRPDRARAARRWCWSATGAARRPWR